MSYELTTRYPGVPGRIVAVNAGESTATVEFFGTRRTVRLDLVDRQVAVGDYIVDHDGYAIRRIPDQDVARTIAAYERLLLELCRP